MDGMHCCASPTPPIRSRGWRSARVDRHRSDLLNGNGASYVALWANRDAINPPSLRCKGPRSLTQGFRVLRFVRFGFVGLLFFPGGWRGSTLRPESPMTRMNNVTPRDGVLQSSKNPCRNWQVCLDKRVSRRRIGKSPVHGPMQLRRIITVGFTNSSFHARFCHMGLRRHHSCSSMPFEAIFYD